MEHFLEWLISKRFKTYFFLHFIGKKRKLNYRVNKKIKIDKEDWIVTENHHKAIVNKEKLDKVQDILDRQAKVNKNVKIDFINRKENNIWTIKTYK